jgi:hypothetical protein
LANWKPAFPACRQAGTSELPSHYFYKNHKFQTSNNK